MRTTLFRNIIMAFGLLLSAELYAQKTAPIKVTVYLKNTTLLPKKYSLISYAPSETGNGTVSKYFLPGQEQQFIFEAGTKVYLASGKQVATVMQGQSIAKDQPFLVVKKSDAGKTFSLK